MATKYVTSAERPQDVTVRTTPFVGDATGKSAQFRQEVPQLRRDLGAIPDRYSVPPRVLRVNLSRADALDVTNKSITWNLDLSALRLRPGSFMYVDGYTCSLNMKADITWSLSGLPLAVYDRSGTQSDLQFSAFLRGENLNTASYSVVGANDRVGAMLLSTELQHCQVIFTALDDSNESASSFANCFFRFYLVFVEPGAIFP